MCRRRNLKRGRMSRQQWPDSINSPSDIPVTIHFGIAIDFPDTYEHLQPEVVPSAFMFFGFPQGGLRATPDFQVAQVLTLVPLLIACVNVGLLIFARTSMRAAEFSVRTALGASRARVISQVFTESLVLAVMAAGVGLLLIGWLPGVALSLIDLEVPYWIDLGVTRATVLWALSLAVCSAAVAGIIPALRATGRSVSQNIQRTQAKRAGSRFGGLSSALIVADVAVAVAVVGIAAGLSTRAQGVWGGSEGDGIASGQFLSARLSLSGREAAADTTVSGRTAMRARMAAAQQALVERLRAEPGVRSVAVGTVLPRMDHPIRQIDLDDDSASSDDGSEVDVRGIRVRTAAVDLDFFSALQQPILAGRGFTTGDLGDAALLGDASALSGGATVVIVNTTFVERVLAGSNPIGRRIRYRVNENETLGPWYEIVGVVGRLGMHVLTPDQDEGIYHPLVPGSVDSVRLAIQVGNVGDRPGSFAPRLRALAREVDPLPTVSDPIALDLVFEGTGT